MFYTGTVGEIKLSQHRSRYFGSITALSSSSSSIYLDIILLVGSKDNFIFRGLYDFTRHPYVMHIVCLLYFTFFPFIPRGESLQISSSEMTNILICCSSCLGLNSIYGEMSQFSRQISRVEVEIQVGKVALLLDARYGSEWSYI